MSSACALRFIPPFYPSFRNSPLLISHPTPLSSPFPRFLRFLSPCLSFPFRHLSFFPSSLVFLPVFSVARLRFPFSSPRLSLSSSSKHSDFIPPSSSISFPLSPLFFLSLVGQFHPFSIRCSLFARVTHRRGETIRRFPGWHLVSRAAFSLSVSLSPVCFHRRSRLLPMTGRRAHTIGGS